jgi:hypothetical protein
VNADAIYNVTKALQDFLTHAINGSPGDVFVGPLDDQNANKAKAVLFLYRIAVNADLRSSTHVVSAAMPSDPPTVYDTSLPLDLYYLFTAGTAQTGGELEALSVLGLAMRALNDSPYLDGLAVRNETVRVSVDPIGIEEMSRIWTLFPTANFRTSVVYLATPVWLDPARPPTRGVPVVEEPHLVGQVGT